MSLRCDSNFSESAIQIQEWRDSAIEKKQQVIERLEDEGRDDLAAPLITCGESISLTCCNCGNLSEAFTHCKKRWCPVCIRGLTAKKAARYRGGAMEMRWPLMVTFTVKNYSDASIDFFREIKQGFRKLRKQQWFRGCVTGGVFAIEVTNTGKGWHPHGHGIFDCRWFGVSMDAPSPHLSPEAKKKHYTRNAREVSEQWSLVMGRKGNVHTRRVWTREGQNRGDAVTEAMKYSVTPETLIESPDDIAPVIDMMTGQRLCVPFGSMFGRLKADDDDAAEKGCQCAECSLRGYIMPTKLALRGM